VSGFVCTCAWRDEFHVGISIYWRNGSFLVGIGPLVVGWQKSLVWHG
jgi:hypothetical protein